MSLNANPPGSIGSGRAVVAEAGKAVPLSSTPTRCLWVMVLSAEGSDVVVGGKDVVAKAEDLKGIPVGSSAPLTIPINDLSAVYIDSESSEDVAIFLYGAA